MKKRILSTLLALTLCLGLLPTAALAAGNTYGPDEEGWGYVTSEKVIDLGEIENDGTEKKKCGSFTVTIKNTGTQPLTYLDSEGIGNGLRYHNSAFSIQPGEEADVTIQYSVPQGMSCKSYEDYYYILFDGAPVNSMIQFLPKFTLVEPEASSNDQPETSSSGSGSGNYSGFVDPYSGNVFVFVDQLGGTSGSSSSKGESTPVNISVSQAESQLDLSFGSKRIDLGTIYQTPGADACTVTVTNNSSVEVAAGFQGGTGVLSGNRASKVLLIEPGESRDFTFKINLQSPKKGSDTLDMLVIVEPKEETCWVTPYYQESWTSGDRYLIEGAYTVSYDFRSLTDAEAGDIDWTVSASSIDFGVSDVPFRGFRKSQTTKITITNQGSLPFHLEAEVDTSACEREDRNSIFQTGISDYRIVEPGKSTEVTVWTDSGYRTSGAVEGCVLKFTAYYPDSKEQNTITADIPLSVKYLYDGGYVIANRSDNSYGTVKTSDGVTRDPYSGNSRFTAKEGSSVTFVMTPYDPTAYHVSDIKLNGESVGIGGLVNNTYTISNIQENIDFEAIFSPGADPNPQQPATGSSEPAAWAKDLVDQAIAEGILPGELQSAYDQPITRREFCLLADALYTKVKGSPAAVDAAITFTDTSDPAVLRMASAGVVNGVGGGAFDPDSQLTREQAATMLSRLSTALGKPLTGNEPTFDDSGSVSGWAKAAVGEMQQSGIMSGTGNNLFSPQMSYTREQSVVTIMRMYEQMK